jgi:hypothetical protein
MASGAKFILFESYSMTCGIRSTSAVHGTRYCGDAVFKTAPFALPLCVFFLFMQGTLSCPLLFFKTNKQTRFGSTAPVDYLTNTKAEFMELIGEPETVDIFRKI